jgi:hypothetical protein
MDDDDKPFARRLKVVTILDATPAYADKPEVGEPIAIVSTEHKGEMEEPMLLTMRDVQLLVSKLEAVMEFHGWPKTRSDGNDEG